MIEKVTIVRDIMQKAMIEMVITEMGMISNCNCPFAAGRRVICKHMIALYFTAEPTVVDEFLKKVEEWEKEKEEEERQHFEELREYVNSLSKVELQEQLYNALVELEDRRNGYW